MNLKISNIGKIKTADIALNGITIIAGDNNTGKSTVGKILFGVFNSCYKIDQYIENQKIIRLEREIETVINTHCLKNFDIEDSLFEFNQLNRQRNRQNNRTLLEELLKNNCFSSVKEYLNDAIPAYIISNLDSPDSVCEEIVAIIDNLNNIPIENFRLGRITNFFNDIFDDQIINVFSSVGTITTNIAGGSFNASFDEEKCINLSLDFKFNNSATFIRNPEILSDYRPVGIDDWIDRDLFRKLRTPTRSDSFDVDHTIATDKLNKVYQLLNNVVKGHFSRNSSRSENGFLFHGMKKAIKIHNLSTGVKSFLILKKLCENGVLCDKDVLILDEPEIHLHPEWQLLYAETLVALQKEFNLTILITSHSPVFVRAIECYCDIYDRMNILDVYKTKPIDEFNYTLENISYSEYGVSELYEDFSRPFEKLENLINAKYEEEDF